MRPSPRGPSAGQAPCRTQARRAAMKPCKWLTEHPGSLRVLSHASRKLGLRATREERAVSVTAEDHQP